MKKLYVIAAFLFAALSAFSRTNDLKLIFVTAPDTIKYKANNTDAPTTFKWGFVNIGPDSLKISDTIYLKHLNVTGSNGTQKLYLTAATHLAPGDTVTYQYSFYFTNVSGGPTISFCDSVWLTDVTKAVVNDPVTSNNKICKTMYVKNVTPSAIEEIFPASENINNLQIFPNPASSDISFKYDLKGEDAKVVIRDVTGRIVYQQMVNHGYGEQVITIPARGFANGIYVTELSGKEIKALGRVMIRN